MYLNDTDYTINDAYTIARFLISDVYEREKVCECCGATSGLIVSRKDGDPRNISEGNLRYLCKSCNISMSKGYVPERIDEGVIVERYNDGEGLLDIAAEFKLPYSRVRTILTRNGVTIRNRNSEKRITSIKSVQGLRGEGKTVTQMARILGVSKTTIRNHLKAIDNGVQE